MIKWSELYVYELQLYASYLNGFLDILNVNEDCYALGGTSKLIASELASLPWAKNRRKVIFLMNGSLHS